MTINALATAMVMHRTTLGTSCLWSATVHEEKSAIPRPTPTALTRYSRTSEQTESRLLCRFLDAGNNEALRTLS